MLTIKNLRKRYGNFQALDGLNLEVADGELFGFVGPNGAGKTTTLKILAGLLVPDEGEVEIGGLDVYSDGKELRRRIGYVPDFFGVYDNLKVSEYMEFFASCYGITGLQARTRCHTLLEQVRLEDKEDFFVDGLSRGMKQRLCLARALIHDPDLLILDEPINGLDPEGMSEVRMLLKKLNQERGITILLSSHILGELSKLATRYGVIRDGRMVQEITAQELEENCRDYLHVRVDKPKEAAVCLEQGLGITHYEARPEGQLLIYDSCESDQVSRTLTGNGIVVRELYLHRRDLEEYFVEMMGGGENA